MGGRTGLRRAEDAPGPQACDQAGAVAKRDPGGRDPGGLCVVAGPFRDPVSDVRGRRHGGRGPGPTVIHWLFPDPEMPPAGMRRQDARNARGVVSRVALGDATGADRPAPQSDQSACDQAKDVEMEEETSRASPPSTLEENLSRDSGYA